MVGMTYSGFGKYEYYFYKYGKYNDKVLEQSLSKGIKIIVCDSR